MATQKQTWSLSGLSVELGIDRRTLARKINSLSPVEVKGRSKLYHMADVFKCLRLFDHPKEDDNGNLRTHEIRLKRAKADREEIKRDEDLGRLVDLSRVRQEQISRELAFKKTFMNLPRTMATRLVGCGVTEIQAVLTK